MPPLLRVFFICIGIGWLFWSLFLIFKVNYIFGFMPYMILHCLFSSVIFLLGLFFLILGIIGES
jgi:hypothetical protein